MVGPNPNRTEDRARSDRVNAIRSSALLFGRFGLWSALGLDQLDGGLGGNLGFLGVDFEPLFSLIACFHISNSNYFLIFSQSRLSASFLTSRLHTLPLFSPLRASGNRSGSLVSGLSTSLRLPHSPCSQFSQVDPSPLISILLTFYLDSRPTSNNRLNGKPSRQCPDARPLRPALLSLPGFGLRRFASSPLPDSLPHKSLTRQPSDHGLC